MDTHKGFTSPIVLWTAITLTDCMISPHEDYNKLGRNCKLRSRKGNLYMSKSALIVDTPKNCLKSEFCIRDKECPQCKLDIALGGNYNTTWEKLDEIPTWCPLTKIPNKKDVDSHGYNAGWNDCISEILKSIHPVSPV